MGPSTTIYFAFAIRISEIYTLTGKLSRLCYSRESWKRCAKKNPDLTYRCGRATAAELALVGINLNFAPVLDVNSNTANPIIGDRAFGAEPGQVIDISSSWMRGLRDGGIIPCGKHFPGHGDTETDSHLALPVVEKSLDALKTVELPPFAHACSAKIQ